MTIYIDLSEDICITQKENDRFFSKVDVSEYCWNWRGAKSHGYGIFKIRSYTLTLSHRLSWYIYNGPVPIDLIICHKCNNPACVNPEHLYAGTYKDNVNDMMMCGHYRGGNLDNRHSRFTAEDVDGMARMRASGSTYIEIGVEYMLSKSQVENLLKGKVREFKK